MLEDREGAGALVKLVDKQVLAQQREEKLKKEEQKKKEKEERLRQQEAKRLERLEKGKVAPADMFRTAEYSEWDDKVFDRAMN